MTSGAMLKTISNSCSAAARAHQVHAPAAYHNSGTVGEAHPESSPDAAVAWIPLEDPELLSVYLELSAHWSHWMHLPNYSVGLFSVVVNTFAPFLGNKISARSQ